jgi:hypothetical protein
MQILAIFIAYPWAALPVGAAFLLVFAHRKRTSALLAGLLWTGYSGYEHLMHTRVLCSGECNIRIDLLLIYPLLVTISVVAIVQALRRRHQ